jgi:hypothetical protein
MIQDDIRDLGFMRVSDYPVHTFNRRQFLGRALRETPSDQNFGGRICAADAPDGLTGIRVGVRRDRACIQDYEVRFRNSRNAAEAFIFKGGLNTCAISLGGPATEALNENALQN